MVSRRQDSTGRRAREAGGGVLVYEGNGVTLGGGWRGIEKPASFSRQKRNSIQAEGQQVGGSWTGRQETIEDRQDRAALVGGLTPEGDGLSCSRLRRTAREAGLFGGPPPPTWSFLECETHSFRK